MKDPLNRLFKTGSTHKCISKHFLLILLLGFTLPALSQDGPGGIGNLDASDGLVMWFIADSAEVNVDNEVTSVPNQVDVVSLTMDELGSGVRPDLVSGAINGHAEISFGNQVDALESRTTLDPAAFPTNTGTILYVLRHDNNEQTSSSYITGTSGTAGSGANRVGSHNPWNGEVFSDLGNCGCAINNSDDDGRIVADYEDEWVGQYGIWISRHSPSEKTLYRDEIIEGPLAINSAYDAYNQHASNNFYLGHSTNDNFQGDFVEMIMFTTELNDAQLDVMRNYLSAKYDLAIANDYYLFQASHGVDVIGIGQTNSTTHAEAKSAGIFTIKDASSIDTDGDFVFTGHDNADASSWTTSEQINGDSNLERIAREWRFDASGNPGTITISIDPTDLPAFNTDFGFYTLWIDNDGDFTNGATQYPLTYNGTTLEYEVSGVTVTDGMYVTIAAYSPEINFVQTAFSGKEDAGDAVFEVSIDYSVDADVTVDYTVSGTCTEDYPADGTFTIGLGNTSTTLNASITSGDAFETDETIILTLTAASQSHGVLGESVSTYTVKDDGTNAANTIQYDAPFSYSHRKTITLDAAMVSGSTDLENFPVMIRIDGADFTEMDANVQSANGYDIRFTYENSVEWLEHQIEIYDDATNNEYVAWVKLPLLSASENTVLEVYYGNALVTTDPSVSSVFGDDYELAMHLSDVNDGSANGNTGNVLGDANFTSTGIVGNGMTLDGDGDGLRIASNSSLTFLASEPMTMSYWYNANLNTGNAAGVMGMINRETGTPSVDGYLMRLFQGDHVSLFMGQDITDNNPGVVSEGMRFSDTDTDISNGNWRHVVMTYDGSATTSGVNFYVDGVGEAIGAGPTNNLTTGSDIDPGTDFIIGGWVEDGIANGNSNSLFQELTGLIDEVRLVRAVVSGDWIVTEYENIANESTHISFSSEVANTGFQIPESTDSINLTVALASVDVNDVSIDYAITSGTASNGSDYTLAAGTVTILANDLSALITVDLSDDAVDEPDETFTVTLTNPVSTSDVSLGTNDEIEITLLDDDDGPVVSVTDTLLSVNEGSDANEWFVSLSQITEQTITVDYTVTAISAVSGSDYIHSSGTLTVSSDSTSASVSFNIIDDVEIEAAETFAIKLISATNATIDAVYDTIGVTINDNDNFGIDGPGGVGDADGTGTLVMWMIADSVTNTGNGTAATFWENEIDIPGLNMEPDIADPTYVANIANGHASVSFSSTVNDRMVSVENLSVSTFPYNEGSVFIVTTHDNLSQQSTVYGTIGMGTRFNSHMPWNGTAYFDIGTCCGPRVNFTYDSDWLYEPSLFSNLIGSSGVNAGQRVYRNGDFIGSDGDVGTITDHTSGQFTLGRASSDNFAGDILEFIMYTSPVNDAQRIITENYLAVKYNIDIMNDFYAFETTHSVELVGIGQEDSENFHTAAKTGLITISNASSLDDGDYVFVGHDNLDLSAWTTTDVPSDLSNIQRIEREYRSDIAGNPGTISIAVDESLLPALPADYTEYVLISDDDGAFSDGATLYPMSLVDGEYVANTVVVAQGTYFTIGTHQRTIEFVGNSIQDFENINNTISLGLSLASGSDISIPYTITGTATQGSDYTIATSGSFTITAGNTLSIIDLGIIDESDEETDETIILTLGASPSGTVLGTNTIFTYTINDDDNERSIIIDHFTSYRDITINSSEVTGSHTDFPVLITITGDADLSATAGSVESVDGYDIAFYDSLNGAWLNHDLEYYNDNGATADLAVWVKIPSLTSSADVNLTMFYGNSGIVFDQSTTDTWGANFTGVWHMDVDDLGDATSNGANGVNQGGVTTSGIVGLAATFDRSTNVKVANTASFNFDFDQTYTVSAWYLGNETAGNTMVGLADVEHGFRMRHNGADNHQISIGDENSDLLVWSNSSSDVSDNTNWYHLVFTYDAGTAITYTNADNSTSLDRDDSPGSNDASPNVAFTIGSASDGGQIDDGILGSIDEVRVSNVVRSGDWITTEYNNVTNAGSFLTIGSHTTTDFLTLAEDFGTVTVPIRVDPVDDTQTTTIDFADAGTGSAIIDSDFTLTSGTISVLAGDNTGTFTFDITNDLTDEIDETIDVQISNPSSNAKLGTVTTQTYTVTDDDDGSTIDFIDDVSVANEGSSLTPLVLQLNVESGQDVSVDYAVTGGDATSGSDFIAFSGTATISAGDLTESISFQPIDDAIIEDPETIEITISNPVNGTLGTNTIHTVTIADNDDLGFEGPGGVGDVENALGENLLKLWLIADSVTFSGSDVTSWDNIIQNVSIDYDMVPATGTAPTVVDAAINGHKEISFDNVSDALVSEGALTALSFPGNELSMFIVAETDNLNQSSYAYATDNSATGLVDGNSISASIPNASAQAEFDLDQDNYTTSYLPAWAGTHSIFTHVVSSDTFLVYRNNGILVNRDDANATFTDHTNYNFYLGKDGSDFFQGDIAEVIMFSRDVNIAQINLINNYLAAKYDLTITDDYYNFEVSHGVEVAGIGQVDENNQHVAARAGIVTISNASDLDDGEFVLFGHDNGDVSNWVTSEVPASGISRTAREWRFDNTGSPGDISIAVTPDLLPALPVGDEDYVILVDTDGDFSSGATVINTILVDGQYKASNLTITSGDYVTFGIATRTVSFAVTSDNGDEGTAANANITLSLENSSDITLDYNVTGGTATGGSDDYSLASSGTVTFIAGQTSVDLALGIINDSNIESDETIEITLSNPPAGVSLGDAVFTYTINDDDNTRTIQFTDDPASSTAAESVTAVSLQVELNQVDATNPTTIDYAVTGGTAEESPSPDYTFTSGTLTINATETTGTIDFTVLDDVLSEDSETVEISLSNPTNANLGARSLYTYTITDNDAAVTVEFQDATTTIDEGGSIAAVFVELSATSGQDVEIDYAVTGGTATGGGTDYSLASGTLVITSGNQLGTINVALTDDGQEESAETIELTLSGEVGATLGTQTVHTITLVDNDAAFGYYGPGGVGDAASNMLWLDATAINGKGVANVADASNVTTWVDRSGNGNDFIAIGTVPVFDEDAFNLKNTVIISSTAQGLQAPGGFSNALSNYSFVSVMSQTSGEYLVETNTAATDEFRLNQGSNGLYAINDTDYLPNASTGEDITTWVFNSESGTSADIYRNGTSLASDNNFQVMSISDNFALGSRNSDQTQAVGDFAGNISEFIMYTNVINDAQRVIIENYLANKYDLTIANDFYAYEGTYGGDIVGIGQNGTDQHLQSMSDSLMMISGASSLGDGDYVFAGHDGGDDLAWTTSEVPSDDVNIQRIAREWRLDVTGTPGTVIIKIDTTVLPAPASGYDEYLVWTDDDGDFRSGAVTYQVEYSETFGFHVSDEITISDGTFLAIGVAQPVVEFMTETSDGDEDVTNTNIAVSLNFIMGEDITIDYAATGGSATGGNVDYLLASGTLTITAGQTSANISLGIIDDAIEEGDETVEVTLSNPSGNISLGLTSEHTYTIHDNDNAEARTVSFVSAGPGSATEGDAPTSVSVDINVADDDVATTVDLSIVSVGNAADETDDFTLSTSTITFPADNVTTSQSFDITIVDDAIFETTELITIQLSNPVNADIGTISEYTFNITDNDTAPEASFSESSSFVSESAGTAQIEVSLDAVSVNDVTVNYTVSATATGGTDYTLADGSILISTGSLSENIQPIIVNDLVTESAETVTVSLTTATNATVGGTIVHVLTINDDDQSGSVGPGGVGDDSNNILWLRGDNFASGTWSDISGNSNDFTGSGSNGVDQINSKPTVSLNGTQSLTRATGINATASDYDIFYALDADVITDQVVFSDVDGFIFGVENSNGGFQDADASWKGDEIATGAATPTIIQYNLESGSGLSAISINGTEDVPTVAFDYTATSMGGTSTIGAGSGGFDGEIGEMIVFNGILNDAQVNIVNNYLSTRYNIAVVSDFFAYDDGSADNDYQYDLIGMGRVDSDNIHVAATMSTDVGQEFLTISNPNGLGDGEYLMMAHDNGVFTGWSNDDLVVDIPNSSTYRTSREWRVDETGDIGSITLEIDTTRLPSPPTSGLTWALIVAADGDFTTIDADYSVHVLTPVAGDIVGVDGLDLNDGDFLTFGLISYQTDNTITNVFNNDDAWTTGVAPSAGTSAVITTGDAMILDDDITVGSLTIQTGGSLDLQGHTLSFSDGCATLVGSGEIIVSTAGSTVGYENPNVVEQCITEMTYNNLYTDGPAGSTKYLLGDIVVEGDITMESSGGSGAIFDVQDIVGSMTDYDITVSGNWSNEITFNPRTGTVTLNGTGDQQVSNSIAGGETFNNLIVNNTGGDINMGSDISTAGVLTLTSGNVVLGSNDFNIDNDAAGSISGGGASSYLVVISSGLLRQSVALTNTYTFPVGDGVFYSPFTFVLNSGTLGSSPNVTLNLRDDTYAGITEPTYISRYWTLEETDITIPFGYNVTYIYDDSDVVGAEAALLATKYTNTSTFVQSGSTDAGTNTVSSGEYDSFSVNTAQSDVTVLPVELLSFGAALMDGRVDLHWATASEINNDYFLIERSANGEEFEAIGEVDGNGTTNFQTNYSFADRNPFYGVSYYRLIQIDYDGTETIYNKVSVNNDQFKQGFDILLIPNPISSNEVTLRLASGDENSDIGVSVYSMTGRLVYFNTFDAVLGTQDILIEMEGKLESGIYHVAVIQGTNQMMKRLMVE